MKKNFIRLIACAIAVSSIVSLSACGDSSTASSQAASSAASTVSTVSDAEVSSAAAADGKYASISDFVNSDEMQSQVASMQESLGESGLTMEISGEDNKLIYTYTYADLSDDVVEAVAEGLEDALDEMADTFVGVASSLTETVNVENPVVVVCYKTSDGTVLCEKEFTAE